MGEIRREEKDDKREQSRMSMETFVSENMGVR